MAVETADVILMSGDLRGVPNALALTGIAVIVGSGLYILHRERVRR